MNQNVYFILYTNLFYGSFRYLYMNMKILISEKQYDLLLSRKNTPQNIDEEGEVDPAAAQPKSGTGSSGDKQGYPEVGKWESGVTRGPANQVGVTKWSDIVGSTLKRGKSNPLK